MNRKYLINKFIVFSIILLFCIYIFMSLPNDINLQIGGASAAPAAPKIPKECLPFTFVYQWIFYIIFLSLLFMVIYLGIFNYRASKFTFADIGKLFLERYTDITAHHDDSPAVLTPSQINAYDTFNANNKPNNKYYPMSSLLCNVYKPCTCCGVKGFNDKSGLCTSNPNLALQVDTYTAAPASSP